MTQSIKDALNNIKDIYMSDSSLATLLDFERVIDSFGVYVFKNWKMGELVEGPIFEKYFVTCTFMWPYKKMPDPRGGEQLLNYNCEVLYKKDTLEFPSKIKSQEDFKAGTKVAKTKKVPVWLVTITIPKDLMDEVQRGVLDIEGEEVELDDVNDAYDEGSSDELSDDQNNGADQGMDDMNQDNMNQGAMPPGGIPNGPGM